MPHRLIDGKLVSEKIYTELEKMVAEEGLQAKLAILMIGENEASQIYVGQKMKMCERLGFEADLHHFTSATTDVILDKVEEMNQDESVSGIIMQLPVPESIDVRKVLEAIDPKKDVDGLTPANIGRTFLGPEFEMLTPCTAQGVLELFRHYGIEIEGREIAVIGQGRIAGRPIAAMLMNRGATVMSCNISTPDIAEHTSRADIVIVAAGQPMLITPEMVKKDAIVVDVGINRLDDGSISGDSDFDGLFEKVSMISPVPGGVGRMTVACLMSNLAKTARR